MLICPKTFVHDCSHIMNSNGKHTLNIMALKNQCFPRLVNNNLMEHSQWSQIHTFIPIYAHTTSPRNRRRDEQHKDNTTDTITGNKTHFIQFKLISSNPFLFLRQII